ncbi:MAG: hypothetical protein FD146_172 [Anaerolineaceae bacterium]|nr:MAG: hypothetical protein FD146_172 [Anaerolineaceae bacterium]
MTFEPPPIYCYSHPGVETTLRCNKCGNPICPKCAVRTPTGYRCKDCVRGQQKIFETAQPADYVFGFLVGGFLSSLASVLVILVGSIASFFAWIVIAAVAPTVGIVIAEALRFVTRKHRSKPLFTTILASIILGAVPVGVYLLLTLDFWSLIFQGIYLFIAVPIIYHRLSGIQLKK